MIIDRNKLYRHDTQARGQLVCYGRNPMRVRARIYRLVIHGTWSGINSRCFFVCSFGWSHTRTHISCVYVCVCLSCAHIHTPICHTYTMEPQQQWGTCMQVMDMPNKWRQYPCQHACHWQPADAIAQEGWTNGIIQFIPFPEDIHMLTCVFARVAFLVPGRNWAWRIKTFQNISCRD